MRKKKGTNICLYYEDDNGFCKYYGGSRELLEGCKDKCKKFKKKAKKQNKYITGLLVE